MYGRAVRLSAKVMNPSDPVRIMIVAGERSGDIYGARLAGRLRELRPGLSLFGCGGELMRREDVEALADLQQFAMVGISEVISGLPAARRAFNQLVRAARERRPQLAVLIDSPSLNMRLAKRLKKLGIPVLYFVSPQIWAWKKWRLRQLPALVDRMVCIFDFEEKIYQRAGIPVSYVGHPLVDRVHPKRSRAEFFAELDLDAGVPTVALLPGSRGIEISYILPALIEAAARLSQRRQLQWVIAVAPSLDAKNIETRLKAGPPIQAKVRLACDSAYDVLAWSDVAVVASGTATVEAALLERPMVVVYRISPITAFFARWMVDVPFYSMVNILAGQRVVEELIQRDFTPGRLAAELERLLDGECAEMPGELRRVRARLGEPGAIERVAAIVLSMATGGETEHVSVAADTTARACP